MFWRSESMNKFMKSLECCKANSLSYRVACFSQLKQILDIYIDIDKLKILILTECNGDSQILNWAWDFLMDWDFDLDDPKSDNNFQNPSVLVFIYNPVLRNVKCITQMSIREWPRKIMWNKRAWLGKKCILHLLPFEKNDMNESKTICTVCCLNLWGNILKNRKNQEHYSNFHLAAEAKVYLTSCCKPKDTVKIYTNLNADFNTTYLLRLTFIRNLGSWMLRTQRSSHKVKVTEQLKAGTVG